KERHVRPAGQAPALLGRGGQRAPHVRQGADAALFGHPLRRQHGLSARASAGAGLHDDGSAARLSGRAGGQTHRRARGRTAARAPDARTAHQAGRGLTRRRKRMAYFAKFTERGQRALLTAQREAAQLGRTYVGTEHLLLGVLSDPGAASVVLKGITLDAARQEIIQILGRGDDDSPVRTMVYTPRTKKVLEQSVREARELKQNYVGTEHILRALRREREGVAAHVMIKMGMDLGKAREELLRALS